LAAQQFGRCQRLHCFAQPHVVRQYHSASAGSEHCPSNLVGKEFGLQDANQWVLSATHLGQQFALKFESLGNLVLAVDVFKDVAVNHGLIVCLPELFQHMLELPKMFRPQQSLGIEILLPQGFQGR
jgi:hypothetical protein